ncbi:MAG: HAD family phosphatase [Planctomycetes bacterium]|nr:HAD family phosphatase [Planctomycetota bacterium]
MPHRRFDAIICDIDGCLGPESHAPLDADALGRIASYNHAAIRTGNAPVVTLCSGRPQPYAEAICRLIGNSTIPCIAEMGVWLYDPRDNRFILDPAILPEHLEAVRDATVWFERELIPQGVVIQPGKTASISIWHPDTAFLLAQKPRIVEAFAAHGWPLRVSNTVAWVNCDLAHVSKSTGIARMMAMTGLNKDRTAGIGDTLGDMAIRERVAFFACPSNADPALKQCADYVSPLEEVQGVLDILENLRRMG